MAFLETTIVGHVLKSRIEPHFSKRFKVQLLKGF